MVHVSASSPSLSVIVTVALALGPSWTPLDVTSSEMDSASWKDSSPSIMLLSTMVTLNSTLTSPGMNSSWRSTS